MSITDCNRGWWQFTGKLLLIGDKAWEGTSLGVGSHIDRQGYVFFSRDTERKFASPASWNPGSYLARFPASFPVTRSQMELNSYRQREGGGRDEKMQECFWPLLQLPSTCYYSQNWPMSEILQRHHWPHTAFESYSLALRTLSLNPWRIKPSILSTEDSCVNYT